MCTITNHVSGNGYPVSAISVSALLVPHWMNLLSLSLLTGTRSRHLLNLFQSSLTCRDLEPVISYFLSRHYISCLHFLSVSSSVRNLNEPLLLHFLWHSLRNVFEDIFATVYCQFTTTIYWHLFLVPIRVRRNWYHSFCKHLSETSLTSL